MTTRNAHHERARSRAFTLVEVLVALAAVTLIAVGLASVFGSVGETVTTGRRVSLLNAYAAQIERQMRADFDNISRDGFMVIRNQYAGEHAATIDSGGVDPVTNRYNVRLNAEDIDGRPRRADEIMFFRTGQFESAREPIHPDLIARSNVARVYYGHGVRFPDDVPALEDEYKLPELNHAFTPSFVDGLELGMPGGPNEFASEWMLLRHVTLLASPSQTAAPLLSSNFYGAPADNTALRNYLADKPYQVGGQPAARSLFYSLSWAYPGAMPPTDSNFNDPSVVVRAVDPTPAGGFGPSFASGILDVCTSNLDEIRSIVLTSTIASAPFDYQGSGLDLEAGFLNEPTQVRGEFATNNPAVERPRMQAWMLDAMPGVDPTAPNPADRGRVRFEPTPPDFYGVLEEAANGSFGDPWIGESRRADQLMLTASNFLPRCTEFIVEYSFGEMNVLSSLTGESELIWHGLPRPGDYNGDGQVGNNEFLVFPFPFDADLGSDGHFTRTYERADGTTKIVGYNNQDAALLFHGLATPPVTHAPELVSFFGYIDPAYQPTVSGDPETVPWPWPRLIRVTLTLADPNDTTIERTFQFIFEVPERNAS